MYILATKSHRRATYERYIVYHNFLDCEQPHTTQVQMLKVKVTRFICMYRLSICVCAMDTCTCHTVTVVCRYGASTKSAVIRIGLQEMWRFVSHYYEVYM